MTSSSSKIRFLEGVSFSIKIATVYFLFGILWILLSDKILGMLVRDQTVLTNVSIIKGWFYVWVTALMFYVLISPRFITDRAGGKRGLLE